MPTEQEIMQALNVYPYNIDMGGNIMADAKLNAARAIMLTKAISVALAVLDINHPASKVLSDAHAKWGLTKDENNG